MDDNVLRVPAVAPISELRRDAAGIVSRAAVGGEPVYVTQRGRPAAVLVPWQEYEALARRLRVLGGLVTGELAVRGLEVQPAEGLSLDEVLARGERELVRAERRAQEERAAALRQAARRASERRVARWEGRSAYEDVRVATEFGPMDYELALLLADQGYEVDLPPDELP